jgi:FlaA1/EpsC-like NDP-sugar epimerase
MHRQLKNPKFYIMLFGDAVIFMLAHVMAYLCRFEFTLAQLHFQQIQSVLIWIVPLKLIIFFVFGLYKGMWRYTSLRDIWHLAHASLFSILLGIAVILYLYRFQGFSRAVFFMDGIFTFLLSGGLRIGIRYFYASKIQSLIKNGVLSNGRILMSKPRKQVLIIGAGDAGEKILREIHDNESLNYHVVGFLDDDRRKKGRSVHGVSVLGPPELLKDIAETKDFDEILIAVPSATGTQMRRMVELCDACKIPYRTLPGIGEIIDGQVSVKALRDVNYQDLLGRSPVSLDTAGIEQYLSDQTILSTVCGGSIGAELCRQVIRFNPKSIILLDASEFNLYQIQMELHHEKNYRKYKTILGRLQDESLMENMFDQYRPDVVFHAAAYKHVPMLENNPWEAVFNNIMGSKIVMEMAVKYGTKKFVLVSTDKAVRPTNVMGASKRITELLLQAFQGNQTKFMAVRFGNVVGSSGSVLPLFRRQIERGGPVTVTHPDVTRYFMTIPEAAQLILQAGAMGGGNEIFILEMGTPVKIADMAKDLIRLSGKEPDRDIEIVFIGLREGEKLYEELITVGEGITKTDHKKIMVLKPNGFSNGLTDSVDFRNWLNNKLEDLWRLAIQRDENGIKEKLHEVAPEYKPQL